MKKVNYFSNLDFPHSEKWNKNRNYAKITIQNVHYSVANSLRRSIMSLVPTIGFRALPYENSTIEVEENNTYLNNEIIKHRISMIPVMMTDNILDNYEDYEFIIDEENNTNMIKLVDTSHFKIRKISTNTMLKEEEVRKILPPNEITNNFIPIVKLKPKYFTNLGVKNLNDIAKDIKIPNNHPIKFKLKARLVKSNGLENGHFSPVCTCAYGYTVDETIIQEAEDNYVNEVNANNKKLGLSEIEEDILRRRFKINETHKYNIKDEYGDPCSFDFIIESIGQYTPLELIHQGLLYLINNLDTFMNDLKLRNENRLLLYPSKSLINGIEVKVNDMNDTLGNLIHCHMIKNLCMFDLKENKKLETFTYNKIHPLKEEVLFTIRPVNTNMDDTINNIIIPELNELINHLKDIDNNLKQIYI